MLDVCGWCCFSGHLEWCFLRVGCGLLWCWQEVWSGLLMVSCLGGSVGFCVYQELVKISKVVYVPNVSGELAELVDGCGVELLWLFGAFLS